MTNITRALTAALVLLCTVSIPNARAQAVNDHMRCYKIKDPLGLLAIVDLNSPQFGLSQGCKVGATRYYCVNVDKTVISAVSQLSNGPVTLLPIGGPDPGDRICYSLKCPPEAAVANQLVSDQFAMRTVSNFKTAMLCTPAVQGTYHRFTDNGDGTVIDHQTGLQWEKKTTTVGSGQNFNDPHDVDNRYTWFDTSGPCNNDCPDGTAFEDFLYKLNLCASSDGTTVNVGGFAGHCDWRLPTIQELKTIVDLTAPGCGAGPCIDSTFGPTDPYFYWSRTQIYNGSGSSWTDSFSNTGLLLSNNNANMSVRAVRRAD